MAFEILRDNGFRDLPRNSFYVWNYLGTPVSRCIVRIEDEEKFRNLKQQYQFKETLCKYFGVHRSLDWDFFNGGETVMNRRRYDKEKLKEEGMALVKISPYVHNRSFFSDFIVKYTFKDIQTAKGDDWYQMLLYGDSHIGEIFHLLHAFHNIDPCTTKLLGLDKTRIFEVLTFGDLRNARVFEKDYFGREKGTGTVTVQVVDVQHECPNFTDAKNSIKDGFIYKRPEYVPDTGPGYMPSMDEVLGWHFDESFKSCKYCYKKGYFNVSNCEFCNVEYCLNCFKNHVCHEKTYSKIEEHQTPRKITKQEQIFKLHVINELVIHYVYQQDKNGNNLVLHQCMIGCLYCRNNKIKKCSDHFNHKGACLQHVQNSCEIKHKDFTKSNRLDEFLQMFTEGIRDEIYNK